MVLQLRPVWISPCYLWYVSITLRWYARHRILVNTNSNSFRIDLIACCHAIVSPHDLDVTRDITNTLLIVLQLRPVWVSPRYLWYASITPRWYARHHKLVNTNSTSFSTDLRAFCQAMMCPHDLDMMHAISLIPCWLFCSSDLCVYRHAIYDVSP